MATSTQTLCEPAAERPVVRDVDVVVAGGGPAGFCAALAAARQGASTLLIERYGYLGGMMTGSMITWVLGVGDGTGKPKARGVVADLHERLERFGGIQKTTEQGDYNIDAEVFKWQAVEMLQEAGAEVLLHTWAADPVLADGAVAGLFVESKSGRQAVRAKVVIDASADADVAFRAGCACDNQTHDVSLIIRMHGVDKDKVAAFEKAEPDKHAAVMAEAKRLNGGRPAGAIRHEKHVDVADAEALTRAEIMFRRDLFTSLAYLKANMPGYENARVTETLHQLGVRQGRRVRGGYVLTNDDLLASKHFDDSVARLGSNLLGYELYGHKELDYDIPYRCLVPEMVDGLLVAGRCISSDFDACNSLRLIVPCMATGQAAGVAAAIAAAQGVAPRAINVEALRAALTAQGVYLG